MLAVDFKNSVVLLDASIRRGGTFYRRNTHDNAVARVDADIADAHLDFGTGGILCGNHEFFWNDGNGNRFATAMHRERNARPEAHANLLAEIVPALRRLAVHGGNGIVRLDARSCCRRILCDKAHDEFVCRRFLHAHHVEHHQEHEREHDIDKRTGKSNSGARPHGLRHKIALVGNLPLLERIGVLARHGHVATERDSRNAVFRLAPLDADELLAEADAKRVHLDVIPLRDQEVAKLMNRHEETERKEAQDKHHDIAENAFHYRTM